MNFLDKLDYLMNRDSLNKNTLSKACNIPYTTIDGWYKKGYEGLKLSTLRKLAGYFGTTLDFWVEDQASDSEKAIANINLDGLKLVRNYNALSSKDKQLINSIINALLEKADR